MEALKLIESEARIGNGIKDNRDDAVLEIEKFRSANEPCSLAWENLKVQTKKGFPILKDLAGELPAGSLTAILGRSGCGKTTLMNVLTSNNRDLEASGNIFVNRVPVGSAISNFSAYVRQEDLFVGELTILEHLNFRARIQFADMDQAERDRKIQKSLEDFELKEVEHTQIGIPDLKKTLSGGERKRLSLASEILSDPKILFCDEPTTGLDSTMALKVIEVLLNLSKNGMTIVCSIHQPSSKIISLFSHLILMSKGEFAYFGSYAESISFVEKLNRPVPPLYNPADHFLEILDPCNKENEDFILTAVDRHRASVQLSFKNEDTLENLEYFNLKRINKVGRISQTCILIRRQLARMIRDPLAVKAKLTECVFIAIWYGMLYWRRDNAWSNETFQYSWAQIRDINGSLLVSLLFVSILFLVMVALRFMIQWPLLQREISDKIYRFSSFFIADNIVTSSFAITLPFLYSIIAYPLFGLQKSFVKWLNFYFVLVLESHVCLGVGYCVSSFSPNVDFTIALLPAAIVPLIVFCGYLLDTSATPPYAGFLKHLSWYGYCNELLQINQWDGLEIDELCHQRPSNSTSYMKIEFKYKGFIDAKLEDHEICQVRYPKGGTSVITEMGFDAANWSKNIAILLVLSFAFRFIAFAIFKFRLNKLKRKVIIHGNCPQKKISPLR